ncbi:MAG: Tfp pilus assembly protein ATPase PilM [Chthonomonadaceae bacterium]|nr:Tfp pilus assembly protein ATPase PilM [Chthonomonadaceae bacterium]
MSSKASSHSAGSSVAFDLGANAVRVVEIEWSGSDGGGRLVKRGSAALPVNVWNDLPANTGAFVAALRQALSNAGITAKSVSASLPRRLVTLRFARLPHAAPEMMRGLVELEAQQYVLFPLDEVILDFHVATDASTGIAIPSEDDMESVLLAAARRTLVTDLIAIFEKAGLELDQLTVSALALAEHIRDSIEATAVIDVEPGEMDVAVVANRQLLFTRASGLDVTGAQPEIAARRLADEIARSFTSFQNEYRHQPLTRISLTGPSVQGAEGFAVEQTLSSVLEMPIGKLSSRLLPATDTDAIAYATAIGAALQTRPGNLASINLVPDERAIKKAEAAQRQRKQLAFVAGLAAVIAGGFFIQHVAAASAKDRAAQLAVNDKLHKFTTALDAKRKTYQTRKALYDELTTGLDRNHPAIDVLVALNRALPQSTQIWLTQFAFDRNGLITLHGDTKSADAATDMVIALQDSGAFTDVKVAYLGDAQETNVVSNDVPAKTPPPAAAPQIPVTPLPAMPPATTITPMMNGPRGNNFGSNGPASPNTGFPGGYTGGSQRNGPGTNTFQPGQGFPGGAPPGAIVPPGQQQQGPPTNGVRVFTPDGQVLPAIPKPATPPPFYLIGFGQDPNGAQNPNGQAQPAADNNGQNGNGGNPRQGRKRNKGGGTPGAADFSGGKFQGGPPSNPGVTPGGPGSSNQVQPGTIPMPQGNPLKPNLPPGGPTVNPTAPQVKTLPIPTPAPVRKPAVTLPTRPKGTLTSFIITCRINPQARTLITGHAPAPGKGGKRVPTPGGNTVRRPIGEDSDTSDISDTGGETNGSP